MKTQFRCDCPISSALDILGDRWTLVIIKQMLLEDAKTFKDFIESDEAIATNILSARLKMLEEMKMVTKEKLPENKKTNIYRLTEKGLALTPIITELALFSDAHLREFNPIIQDGDGLAMMREDKDGFNNIVVNNYKVKK